jgi:lysozyme
VPRIRQQYDALVSFVYNVGVGAFERSTLLRLINQGKYAAASEQFLRWNKITVNGNVSEDPGLSNRRSSEKALFETGAYD